MKHLQLTIGISFQHGVVLRGFSALCSGLFFPVLPGWVGDLNPYQRTDLAREPALLRDGAPGLQPPASFSPEELRGDREVVQAAVTQDGSALQFVCQERGDSFRHGFFKRGFLGCLFFSPNA